jgi:hypothetical protein
VTGGGTGLTFAAPTAPKGELALAPDGTLGLSQRVVPLDIVIDKSVPWQIVGDYDRFELETPGPGLASTGALTDWFAPSSYVDLRPRERLSAPSFEQLESGLVFSGGAATAGPVRAVTLEYEQILRDPGLGEDGVGLGRLDLGADPRARTLAGIDTTRGAATFSIAVDATGTRVVPARYVAADRLTGATLARGKSWTAARQSPDGRRSSTTIVPSWEGAA